MQSEASVLRQGGFLGGERREHVQCQPLVERMGRKEAGDRGLECLPRSVPVPDHHAERRPAALGGEMLASRLWEERRLAYPIDGHRKGTYWLTYFKLDSTKLADLNRQCQLSDSIVRTLFLKVDPRISDALVSHALSGTTVQRRAPEPVAAAVPPAIDLEGEDE